MAKKKVQVFVNVDDNRYVAIGEDETNMPTFRIATGYRVPTDFKFPECLRFMPEAEPRGDMVEIDVAVIDQIYGLVWRPRRLPKDLTGEDMADRDLSRFTAPIEGIVRDENGRIISPPSGPERDRALEIEQAWDEYWMNDDETELIRLGIFPERESGPAGR